jgi:hypothetical protein
LEKDNTFFLQFQPNERESHEKNRNSVSLYPSSTSRPQRRERLPGSPISRLARLRFDRLVSPRLGRTSAGLNYKIGQESPPQCSPENRTIQRLLQKVLSRAKISGSGKVELNPPPPED